MIDPRALRPLSVTSRAIFALIPHRAPLLLVDTITAYASSPWALVATKHISASEPVLTGHFPQRPVWPGAYTLEGLAQGCALLGALQALDRAGISVEAITADGALPQVPPSPAMMLANADIKFVHPVLPATALEYVVLHTHDLFPFCRFDVEARAGGKVVAQGRLTTVIESQ